MTTRSAILLVAIALAGCDIPGRLIVKNRSDVPMRVRFVEHPNPTWPTRGMHGDAWANKEPNIFTVNLRPHARVDLPLMGPYADFGWSWDSTNVAMYASRLDRIDVVTGADSVAISDQADLRERLWNGRRGLLKTATVLKLP